MLELGETFLLTKDYTSKNCVEIPSSCKTDIWRLLPTGYAFNKTLTQQKREPQMEEARSSPSPGGRQADWYPLILRPDVRVHIIERKTNPP